MKKKKKTVLGGVETLSEKDKINSPFPTMFSKALLFRIVKK